MIIERAVRWLREMPGVRRGRAVAWCAEIVGVVAVCVAASMWVLPLGVAIAGVYVVIVANQGDG
jgi:hypothetical protein